MGPELLAIVSRRPGARLARITDGVGLYLFCTWTGAFLRISRIRRFGSLRSLSNSAILADQLPPPPPLLHRTHFTQPDVLGTRKHP